MGEAIAKWTNEHAGVMMSALVTGFTGLLYKLVQMIRKQAVHMEQVDNHAKHLQELQYSVDRLDDAREDQDKRLEVLNKVMQSLEQVGPALTEMTKLTSKLEGVLSITVRRLELLEQAVHNVASKEFKCPHQT